MCDWSEEGTTRRTETETETRHKRKTLPSRVGFLGLQVSESRPFAGLRRLRLGERHGQTRLALDETAKQSLFCCWRFVANLSTLGFVLLCSLIRDNFGFFVSFFELEKKKKKVEKRETKNRN